jgi:hypothetical protein
MQTADKIGDVDDVKAELRREIAKRRAADQRIDALIAKARAETPPVEYAELEEITGLSREWLRKIVKGTAPTRRPRRQTKPGD